MDLSGFVIPLELFLYFTTRLVTFKLTEMTPTDTTRNSTQKSIKKRIFFFNLGICHVLQNHISIIVYIPNLLGPVNRFLNHIILNYTTK